MTMECPDPVIIPPTCQILCAASVLPGTCDTAYFWEPLQEDFVMPAVSGAGVISVCNSSQYAIGANVWIAGLGYLTVTGRPNANSVTIQNDGFYNNAAPGAVAATGAPAVHCPPPVPAQYPPADWLTGTAAYAGGTPTAAVPVAVAVAVVGAALGDFVLASYDKTLNTCQIGGYVSVAGTVTVMLTSTIAAGAAVAAGNVSVIVIPR